MLGFKREKNNGGFGLFVIPFKKIHFFADYAAKIVELTKPLAQMGGYELYDLVQLIDKSFGVIIRMEIEGLEVFQGVPDRPKVRVLREIRNKIGWCKNANDRSNNIISAKGKQGLVKHIFNGRLFIRDPCRPQHAGFICTKAQSCLLVGGSNNRKCWRCIGGHDLVLRVLPRPTD